MVAFVRSVLLGGLVDLVVAHGAEEEALQACVLLDPGLKC